MHKSTGRVTGAGLMALDVVVRADDDHGALLFAGGTCGNVLAILSYLHWDAQAVGYLGNDVAADLILKDLQASGVHAGNLQRHSGHSTPVFVQRLQTDSSGTPRHTFSRNCPDCGGAIGSKSTPGADPATPIRQFARAEKPDVFFMDRLSADIVALAESAKAQGSMVFYEPSVRADAELWEQAFQFIDIVKYSADRFSEDEFDPYLSVSKGLWEVQTLGAEGLRYRRRGHSHSTQWNLSPAVAAPRVVDTCGAGDWCSAGLLHGLIVTHADSDHQDIRSSVRLGQTLAAWACAFVGARGAMYAAESKVTWEAISKLSDGERIDMNRWPETQGGKSKLVDSRAPCFAGSCADSLSR